MRASERYYFDARKHERVSLDCAYIHLFEHSRDLRCKGKSFPGTEYIEGRLELVIPARGCYNWWPALPNTR